jgi:hypothetical protein
VHPRLRRAVPPAPLFAEAARRARRLADPEASVAQAPVLPSAEPVAQDAAAGLRRAAQGAEEALQPAAERRDAAAEPLQEAAGPGVTEEPQQAAEVWDVAAALRPGAQDAAEGPRQEARVGEVRPRAARGAAAPLRAVPGARALPSAAASAFHRDRVLPSPVRRQAARTARAKACFRIASPSEPWWRAVRDEVLS